MSYYHQGHYYRTDEWGTVVEGPADGAWPTQPGYSAPEPQPQRLPSPPLNPYDTRGEKPKGPFTVYRGGSWLYNVELEQLRAFDLVLAENGYATIYPEADFETYSEAGYLWVPELRKWKSLPGLSDQNRGLKAVGTRNYVEHPSFRVLSLAWNLKDGKGDRWWRPMTNETLDDLFPATRRGDYTMPWAPGELCDYIANGGILEAWNINFEYVVWNSYCVPIFGWPVLKQEQCRDGMAKGRAAAWPGNLDDFGRVRKMRQQKDPEGKPLIRKLTVPRNPTKANPDLRWTPLTAKEDFAKFYDYNVQDCRAEAEASAITPDLTERELSVWLFDLRCNMRGMQIDMDSVEHCIAIIEQAELKYNAELYNLTNRAVESYTEVEALVGWCRTQGVYLGKLDAEALEVALKRTDYPRNVQRALRIRQILAFSSVKKYYALRAQTTPYGRLFDQYAYYGAHTGLWNGRDVQPANLYKGIFSKPEQVERALSLIRTRCLELIEYEYGEGGSWETERDENGRLVGNKPVDALEVVASCLRSMIIAKPGHKLISADFSSIQAVATSCMADERWRIEVFRTHGNIYYAMASQLTGNPIEYYLDYKKQTGKHHEHRQSYGKLPVLSGDFGAWINGWKRFHADKILGSDENIKKMILLTRDRQPNIVNFWGGQTWNKFRNDERPLLYGLEGAAVSAILEPGTCFSSRPGSPLGVLYEVHNDILYCRPPSGGFIRYHAPRLTPATRDYSRPWEYEMSYEGYNTNQQKGPIGWIRMKLYGGVQTQNTISHMCREIQADALRALEYAKPREYNIVMHTHDEQLAEVPDRIEYNPEEYTAIVRNSLAPWAVCIDGKPWPIKVPLAWSAYRYGKWED